MTHSPRPPNDGIGVPEIAGEPDPFRGLDGSQALREGLAPATDGSVIPPEAQTMFAMPGRPPTTLRDFLVSPESMRILWKSESERAEALIFEFAQRGMPEQVVRWTGWSGNIGEHVAQLPNLARAFTGLKGFHMFGGTQMHDLDTGQIRPTVCDVPVALKRADPDLILIGVIPKVEEEPRYLEGFGVIVRVEPDHGHFTTINPDQNMALVLQPDVNRTYRWIDEIKESHRQCSRLMEKGWNGTLVVFGGRPTAPDAMKPGDIEQEVRMWAETARQRPDAKLNIILIRGSGGVADRFANDSEWLSNNPCAHAVDLDRDAIHALLNELDLVNSWEKEY